MSIRPAIVVPIGFGVAAISLGFLYLYVEGLVGNRVQYQSWIPWFIGISLALVAGWRGMATSPPHARRVIIRSLVLTLLLGPVPYGPEGTVIPAFLAMIFPPLVMVLIAPVGPALTFIAMVGVLGGFESIAYAARKPSLPLHPARQSGLPISGACGEPPSES